MQLTYEIKTKAYKSIATKWNLKLGQEYVCSRGDICSRNFYKKLVLTNYVMELCYVFPLCLFLSLFVFCTVSITDTQLWAASIDGLRPTWQPAVIYTFYNIYCIFLWLIKLFLLLHWIMDVNVIRSSFFLGPNPANYSRQIFVFLQPAGGHWFHAEKVHDWLYLIREMNFFEGNRCNIWLIKGFTHDVIIDTGMTSQCTGAQFTKYLEISLKIIVILIASLS